MLRNKCAKVVLRAQWLGTVEGSWEKVVDSSLVQCKTRFVQVFHIFFFAKHIFLIFPLISYLDLALSYALGDLGTRLPIPSLSLSQLCMNTFCFITMRAALFLSQTISAIKCCSRWELICFLSRLQLFPKNSALISKIMWSSELQSMTLIDTQEYFILLMT